MSVIGFERFNVKNKHRLCLLLISCLLFLNINKFWCDGDGVAQADARTVIVWILLFENDVCTCVRVRVGLAVQLWHHTFWTRNSICLARSDACWASWAQQLLWFTHQKNKKFRPWRSFWPRCKIMVCGYWCWSAWCCTKCDLQSTVWLDHSLGLWRWFPKIGLCLQSPRVFLQCYLKFMHFVYGS